MQKVQCTHCHRFMALVKLPENGEVQCLLCSRTFSITHPVTEEKDQKTDPISQKTALPEEVGWTSSKPQKDVSPASVYSEGQSIKREYKHDDKTEEKAGYIKWHPPLPIYCPYCYSEVSLMGPCDYTRCSQCHAKIQMPEKTFSYPENTIPFALCPDPRVILSVSSDISSAILKEKWRAALAGYHILYAPLAFAQIMGAFYSLEGTPKQNTVSSILGRCIFCQPFEKLGLRRCPVCGTSAKPYSPEILENMKKQISRFQRQKKRSRVAERISLYCQAQEMHLAGEYDASELKYQEAIQGIKEDGDDVSFLKFGVAFGNALLFIERQKQDSPPLLDLCRALHMTLCSQSDEIGSFQPIHTQESPVIGKECIQLVLTYLFLSQGDTALAEMCLENIIPESATNIILRFAFGLTRFLQGKYREARDILEPICETWPDACLLHARSSIFLEEYEGAISPLETLCSKFPENAIPFYYLGCLKCHLGLFCEAEVFFKKALVFDPSNVSARVQLGMALISSGKKEDGILLIAEADASGHASSEIQIALGRAYYKVGDIEKAKSVLKKASAESPKARYVLAKIYEATVDDKEALIEYESLVKSGHGDRKIWLDIGLASTRFGKRDTAEKYLVQAYESGERCDACLAALGYNLVLNSKDIKKVSLIWKELFLRHPDAEALRYNISQVHYLSALNWAERGKLHNALIECDRHLKIAGDDNQIYKLQGYLHFIRASRCIVEAINGAQLSEKVDQDLDMALKSHPSHPLYLHYLGLLSILKHDNKSAAEWFRKALGFSSNNGVRHMVHLALALLEDGQTEEALKLLEPISFDASSPNIASYMAGSWIKFISYLKKRERYKAAHVLQDVLKNKDALIKAGVPIDLLRIQLIKCISHGKEGQALETALKDVGKEVGEEWARVVLYTQKGDIEKAETFLNSLKGTQIGDDLQNLISDFYLSASSQYCQRRNFQKAEECLKNAIVAFPNDKRFILFLESLRERLDIENIRSERAERVKVWERWKNIYQQTKNPELLHSLTILTHRLAIEHEEGGRFTEADMFWNDSACYWLELLKSEEFWKLEEKREQEIFKRFEPEILQEIKSSIFEEVVLHVALSFCKQYNCAQRPERARRIFISLEPLLNYKWSLNPNDEKCRDNLMQLYIAKAAFSLEQGNWEGFWDQAQKAREITKNKQELEDTIVSLIQGEASIAYNNNDPEKARQILEKGYEQYKNSYLLARELSLLTVAVSAEEFRKIHSNRPEPHEKTYQLTKDTLIRALEIDPYNVKAYINLSSINLGLATCRSKYLDFENTALCLAEAIACYPKNVDQAQNLVNQMDRVSLGRFTTRHFQKHLNSDHVQDMVKRRKKAEDIEAAFRIWDQYGLKYSTFEDLERDYLLFITLIDIASQESDPVQIYDEMILSKPELAVFDKNVVFRMINALKQVQMI